MFNANDLARYMGDFKWHTAQDFKIKAMFYDLNHVSAMQYDSVYTSCSLETQKPKAEWGYD